MTGLLRLAAVVGIVSWYFIIRWAVWNYIIAPVSHGGDFIGIIVSYWIALPVTLISMMAIAGVYLASAWVVDGFNK